MTTQLTENQERWLQALESGEYRQTHQVLRNSNDEYCCLGVGCNLVGLPSELTSYGYVFMYEDDGETFHEEAEAPRPLREWLGLRNSSGTPNMLGDYVITEEEAKKLAHFNEDDDDPEALNYYPSLIALNDGGFTFAEIAAIVRRNPEAWFVQH